MYLLAQLVKNITTKLVESIDTNKRAGGAGLLLCSVSLTLVLACRENNEFAIAAHETTVAK